MATLEKLRSKGGVIIVVTILLALLAFILNDLLSNTNSLFIRSRTELANVNGKFVSINDFHDLAVKMEEYSKLSRGVSSFTEEESHMLRDQTWNQLLNELLLEDIFKKLGIVVSPEELRDMAIGNNIHPWINQLFADPQTGIYNKEYAIYFLQSKNEDTNASFFWDIFEKQIMHERKYNKYLNLIKKGMYVTNAWIEDEIASRSKSVDFDFVMVRYATIPDSTVIIDDLEINTYYKDNIDQFKQEASRDFEYVTFSVVPSDADREMVHETMLKMNNDFSNPQTNAIQYVQLNSDEPFDERFYRANALNPQIEDFVLTAEINDVFGPYFENEAFKLSRLVDIVLIPDSVKARHILIQEESVEESLKVADSLLNLLKKGTDFALFALMHSKDQGSAINGGDLGWFTEGQMVKPFNDACFQGKKGDLVSVESQYGVHIINIQDQTKPIKKYQVATLERKITYSSKTYQDIYSKANIFKANNNDADKFNEAVTVQNLTKRFGRQVRENERRVGTLESPREMVKWAFRAKIGEVSPVFEFGNQFVIALLTASAQEGFSLVEDVKPRIERELMNNKKAEMLITQFNTASSANSDLSIIAEIMNATVQSAENITFSSFSVPGAGSEPALVSLSVHSPANIISKPVKGNNGVFIVKVNSENFIEVKRESIKTQLANLAGQGIDYQLIESIKKNAKIKDNRSKFY